MAIDHPIRVIAFQECDQWVAQCLEHDICAQAPDLDTLYARVEATLLAEDAALREGGKGGIQSPFPARRSIFFACGTNARILIGRVWPTVCGTN